MTESAPMAGGAARIGTTNVTGAKNRNENNLQGSPNDALRNLLTDADPWNLHTLTSATSGGEDASTRKESGTKNVAAAAIKNNEAGEVNTTQVSQISTDSSRSGGSTIIATTQQQQQQQRIKSVSAVSGVSGASNKENETRDGQRNSMRSNIEPIPMQPMESSQIQRDNQNQSQNQNQNGMTIVQTATSEETKFNETDNNNFGTNATQQQFVSNLNVSGNETNLQTVHSHAQQQQHVSNLSNLSNMSGNNTDANNVSYDGSQVLNWFSQQSQHSNANQAQTSNIVCNKFIYFVFVFEC